MELGLMIGILFTIVLIIVIFTIIFKIYIGGIIKYHNGYLIYKNRKIEYSSIKDVKIKEIWLNDNDADGSGIIYELIWITDSGKEISDKLSFIRFKTVEKNINNLIGMPKELKEKACELIEQHKSKLKREDKYIIIGAVIFFAILAILKFLI